MRIFYVAESNLNSRSANSIHVMKMCQALKENGHHVTLIVPESELNILEKEEILKKYNIKTPFEIEFIKVNKIKGWTLIYGLLVYFKLKNKDSNSIIYGRSFFSSFFLAKKRKTAWESHDSFNSKLKFYLFFLMNRRKKYQGTVVISNELKKYYIENFKKTKKIIVAHDGADKIENKESCYVKSKKPLIGYIGHLYKGKGMEIIAALVERYYDLNFEVVGGTEEDINYWKKKIGDVQNINFVGYVEHREVDSYMRKYDIVLAPYQNKVNSLGGGGDISKWMSPLKIFEYMSHGKAIVSSDLKVLKEVLRHNENSLLCPPEDISTWGENIKKLLSSPDLVKKIGENAKKDFEKNYTWLKRAEKVIGDIYG